MEAIKKYLKNNVVNFNQMREANLKKIEEIKAEYQSLLDTNLFIDEILKETATLLVEPTETLKEENQDDTNTETT